MWPLWRSVWRFTGPVLKGNLSVAVWVIPERSSSYCYKAARGDVPTTPLQRALVLLLRWALCQEEGSWMAEELSGSRGAQQRGLGLRRRPSGR